MCSSGKPFLFCGKSNRHRCVPFTSPVQSFEGDCSAEARPPDSETLAAGAAPSIRPRKLRRWGASDITSSPSEELVSDAAFSRHLRDRNRPAKDDIPDPTGRDEDDQWLGADQAMMSRTTVPPCGPVRRTSNPWYLTASFAASIPSR